MTVSIDPDPLFDEAEPPAKLVTGGRYRLPNRDGSHHPGGWMRTTNLASALLDQKELQNWEVQQVLKGIRARPDLVDELLVMDLDEMSPTIARKELLRLAEEAKGYAGADEAKRRGLARHTMVERWHATGEMHGTTAMRAQLGAYVDILEAHQLAPVPAMQERIIICEELNCAGTFDTAVQDLAYGGALKVADLKTQMRVWTLMQPRCQLAIYAHADAMWDKRANRYVDAPRFDRQWGAMVWMPREVPEDWDGPPEEQVRVIDLDLVKGWRTALRAHEICQDRAEAKSTATLRAMFRPLPAPVEVVLSDTEAYAARFAACGSREEGTRLFEEATAAGLWGPELAGCAALAAARLRADRDA
jgi:hypothetical protein